MTRSGNRDDPWAKTVVSLPFEKQIALRHMTLAHDEAPGHDISLSQQQFKIRLANSEGRRESASLLIKKRYAWRGYDTAGLANETPNRITLMADTDNHPIGTLTIGLDSPSGLLVDQLYRDEIDKLRAGGAAVCEFTKLAIDEAMRSKRVLAALFQLAYVFSHRIHGATDVVIEVNPRHIIFYKRMLGFEKLGSERMCARVSAPAVLLHLRLAYATAQIAKFGGTFANIPGVRSLYPYFMGLADENGIFERLVRAD